MQHREWKARATAELARAYKVWPPRIPEHVWRAAYISGNSPEEGATAELWAKVGDGVRG